MKICKEEFTDTKYDEIFAKYPFALSNFQKWAIKGITEDKSILITAHTGSGKTLPAEYAIEYFVSQGKKVIYTCPIKALSNDKKKSLSKKFPHISFGILTGDVKDNPEADVLIMTTEILRNTLFQKQLIKKNEQITKELLHFDMDTENDLAAVVFDEIHYIGDKHRGRVWEETLMMLNRKITVIGLSATISHPELFCNWIETINKDMYLCPNHERVVPLYQHMFFTFPDAAFKKVNKENMEFINNYKNKPVQFIKNHQFRDNTYLNVNRSLEILEERKIRVHPHFVLNQMIEYMKLNDGLPCIIFVFSKKKIHEYAKSITVNLFDEGDKTPSIMRKRCEKILINKLDNYKEYTSLPEFNEIVSLLEKGIAIHHSGITSIFREMVETLFDEKLIKVLFATETFAVGINMPTKSTVFTNIMKYSDEGYRLIQPHEYTQMAGRAGRRGIDDKGLVYHAVNMYYNESKGPLPYISEFKHITSGKPSLLKSRFCVNFNMILRLLSSADFNIQDFVTKNMGKNNEKKEIIFIEKDMEKIKKSIEEKEILLKSLKTNVEDMNKYKELSFKLQYASNKQRKKLNGEINNIKSSNPTFEKDILIFEECEKLKEQIKKSEKQIYNIKHYANDEIETVIKVLTEESFIDENKQLTVKGLISSNIQEFHSLAMGELIHEKGLNNLTVEELVAVLSIFTNIKLSQQNRILNHSHINCDGRIKFTIGRIQNKLYKYEDIEAQNKTSFTEDYNIHYDIVEFMYNWCFAENEEQCMAIFNEAKQYDIYIGDLVKAVLKINNIANELEKVCLLSENFKLLEIVKQIPSVTMKNIATNQSLYL